VLFRKNCFDTVLDQAHSFVGHLTGLPYYFVPLSLVFFPHPASLPQICCLTTWVFKFPQESPIFFLQFSSPRPPPPQRRPRFTPQPSGFFPRADSLFFPVFRCCCPVRSPPHNFNVYLPLLVNGFFFFGEIPTFFNEFANLPLKTVFLALFLFFLGIPPAGP